MSQLASPTTPCSSEHPPPAPPNRDRLAELLQFYGLAVSPDPTVTDCIKVDVIRVATNETLCCGVDNNCNLTHAVMRALYDTIERVDEDTGRFLTEIYSELRDAEINETVQMKTISAEVPSSAKYVSL